MKYWLRSICSVVLLTTSYSLVSASLTLADSNYCQLRVYVIDKKSDLLNVRKQPNSHSQILGKLPGNAEVQVLKTTGNWMLISPLSPASQKIAFQGQGWVFKSFLGLGSSGYGRKTVTVFSKANTSSRIAGRIPSARPVKLISCQGRWALIEKDGVEGWLPPKDQCPAALTSCS